MSRPYKKRAIPMEVKRELARRAGAQAGDERHPAYCHYCGYEGYVWWPIRGRRSAWLVFYGLEMDHVEAEFNGGEATIENIVLACQTCNRSKGYRNDKPLRTGAPCPG